MNDNQTFPPLTNPFYKERFRIEKWGDVVTIVAPHGEIIGELDEASLTGLLCDLADVFEGFRKCKVVPKRG